MLFPKRTPRLLARLITALNRRATIASLPRRLRRMAGVRQSRLTDVAVTAVMRMAFRLVAAAPSAVLGTLIRQASPLTASLVDHVLTGVEPYGTRKNRASSTAYRARPNEPPNWQRSAQADHDRPTPPRDDARKLLEFQPRTDPVQHEGHALGALAVSA